MSLNLVKVPKKRRAICRQSTMSNYSVNCIIGLCNEMYKFYVSKYNVKLKVVTGIFGCQSIYKEESKCER